jgi:nicotinamidase-related amidase
MHVQARPYAFPHDLSFDPRTTALVVIDMQREFCEVGGYLTESQGYPTPLRATIAPILALLTAFRAADFPIYFTREGHRPDLSTLSSRELTRSYIRTGKGIGDDGPLGRFLVRGEPGHNIIPELAPLDNEPIVDKPGRSAFAHTDLELMLRIRGVRNLVLVGVTTDVCVHTTMREANDRGFDVCLVEDATEAGTKELHEASVASVLEEGGIFGCVTKTKALLVALATLGDGGRHEDDG